MKLVYCWIISRHFLTFWPLLELIYPYSSLISPTEISLIPAFQSQAPLWYRCIFVSLLRASLAHWEDPLTKVFLWSRCGAKLCARWAWLPGITEHSDLRSLWFYRLLTGLIRCYFSAFFLALQGLDCSASSVCRWLVWEQWYLGLAMQQFLYSQVEPCDNSHTSGFLCIGISNW